jgi:hypothetical protein
MTQQTTEKPKAKAQAYVSATRLMQQMSRPILRVMHNTFPNGFVLNARNMRVVSQAMARTLNENDFDWSSMIGIIFTPVGVDQYGRNNGQTGNDAAAELERKVAVMNAERQARLFRDRAQFMKTYGVNLDALTTTRFTSEQRTAFDVFEERNRKARLRITATRQRQVQARIEAVLTHENADQYVREALQKPFDIPQPKEGEAVITGHTLANLGSCSDYVNRMYREFPDGVVITEDVCVTHHRTFDWYWAIERMVSGRHIDEWNQLRVQLHNENIEVTQYRDALTEHERRLGELERVASNGLITNRQYREKRMHEIARWENDQRNTASVESIANARAFARIYAQHQRDDLAGMAYNYQRS